MAAHAPSPPEAQDSGQRLPEQVIEAAILWSVKLNYGETSAETRATFQQWLAADPLHRLAWQRTGGWKPLQQPALIGLAHDTLAVAERKHQQHSQQRRRGLTLLTLSGLAAALGWEQRDQLAWQRLVADASTMVGEQRTLRLDDGSVIMLNTDSAVSTDFSADHRNLTLHRGEMMIATGADRAAASKRPFWVTTPFGAMRALGTRFVVRLEPEGARVSVQEGAVELHPADGGTPAVVPAGASLWLAKHGTQPAPPLGFADDGFADGVITGQNIRLDVLLRELARYRKGYISCAPEVAGLRVSGLFHVADTDRALQFLLQTQPVSIRYLTRFWVAVGPAQAA
jgi:transmembrane sensor